MKTINIKLQDIFYSNLEKIIENMIMNDIESTVLTEYNNMVLRKFDTEPHPNFLKEIKHGDHVFQLCTS